MPSIESLPSKQLCEVYFTYVCKKTLPDKWKLPLSIEGIDQYAKYSGGPGMTDFLIHIKGLMPVPSPYIWEASTHELQGDTAKDIGKQVKEFCEKALDKFKQAHDMARMQAKFKDWKILSPCAIGPPGCLEFPKLKDQAPFSSWESSEKEDNAKAYAKAVVEGLSEQFDKWAGKVMCPGLPLYPAFIVYPGPMAPPTPCIPMPLLLYPSAMMAEVTQPKLKDAMVAKLASKVKDEDGAKLHVAIFDSIAFPISLNFLLWTVMQQVMNVMGKGPVPTFAPPYMPMGPVLNGDIISVPGHLAA